MENRRRRTRFSIQLDAQYCFDDSHERWEGCTIIDVSHEGMGIRFKAAAPIETGANIQVEFLASKAIQPIRIKGRLQWIEKGGDYCVGGVKLTEILDVITWSNLMHYIS